jgi:hypothetical protein
MSPKAALLPVFWPALIALAVLIAGLALRRWRSSGSAAGAIAIAAAFVTADLIIRPGFRLLPQDATRWLLHVAVILGAVAVVRAVSGRTLWGVALSGLSLGAATALLVQSDVLPRMGTAQGLAVLLILTLLVVIMHTAGRISAMGSPAWVPPMLLAAACGGAAIAMGQSFTASLAQLAGGLAAALGAMLIMAAWWPRMGAAAGGMPLATVLYSLLVLAARFYADLPLSAAVLLLLAGLTPAAFALAGAVRVPLAARVVLGLLAIGVLAAAAVWLTPMGFDFSPTGGY